MKLTRKSETYQWVERTHKRRIREDEHRTRVETSYTYDTRWRRAPIRSSNFSVPARARQPGTQSFRLEDVRREGGWGRGRVHTDADAGGRAGQGAQRAAAADGRERTRQKRVGAQGPEANRGEGRRPAALDAQRIGTAARESSTTMTTTTTTDEDEDRFALESRLPEMPVAIRAPRSRTDGRSEAAWSTRGSDSAATTSPLVGDRRVAFSAVPGKQTVSVLAKQEGKNGSLRPWTSPSGRRVAIVRHGRQFAERDDRERGTGERVEDVGAEGAGVHRHDHRVGVDRVAGAGDRVVPAVDTARGRIRRGRRQPGRIDGSRHRSVVCACGVIGTSWLAHRPALAYTLFAVSAGSYAWAWASGSRRREAERGRGG